MLRRLKKLFTGAESPDAGARRLSAAAWPSVIYAIGDVHGCIAELEFLESLIVADAAAVDGEKWIVMLGDYLDRGPASAAVLDHLCRKPPAGFRRILLAGNHETMFLSYLQEPTRDDNWLRFGGIETLASYGMDLDRFISGSLSDRRRLLAVHIPDEHLALLSDLPVMLSVPGTSFVHAGLRPGLPLDRQADSDLLWIREPFLSSDDLPTRVVHGHTPIGQPSLGPNRIGIDTGAYATGILTAARLGPAGDTRFLDTRAMVRA